MTRALLRWAGFLLAGAFAFGSATAFTFWAVQSGNSHKIEAWVRPPTPHLITQEEATHLAEQFIADQGYTNQSPAIFKVPVCSESVYPRTDWRELAERRNELKPKAFRVVQSHPDGSWLVIFAYGQGGWEKYSRYIGLENHGRAVKMDAFGKKIHLMHQDAVLNPFN
ncbi:MAG: hypothetical protein K1Y36_22785 [Blastocatellia bacterium]|nr:hypothetical protein [Blastocatellia bacterium]